MYILLYIYIYILFFIVHVFNFQTLVGNCGPGCNPAVTKRDGKLRKTKEFGDHYNQQTWGCFKNLRICNNIEVYVYIYIYYIYTRMYIYIMYMYVDMYVYM